MMANHEQVWSKAEETMRAFVPYYQEKTMAATRDAPPHWNILLMAAGQEPKPLTSELLYTVYPYTSRPAIDEAVQQHIEEGTLRPDDQHGYCLTEKGRAVFSKFFQAAHEAMDEIDILPAKEATRLRHLLQCLVQSAAEAPEPALKHAFRTSRWSDPGEVATAATHIDQYITDLHFFRDDAHIAAWTPSGLDGAAWEALTLIWRDEAHSAAELAEHLSAHSHLEDDYARVLQDLARRQLIEERDGTFYVTDEGRRMRQEAEEKTDALFYAPWSALSDEEVAELDQLLAMARDELQAGSQTLLWPLAYSVSRSINPVTREVVLPVIQEHLDNPRLFLYLRLAREVAPQPYDVERFLMRYPYNNPQHVQNILEEATQGGFLASGENGTYTVTEKGKAAVDVVNDRFYEALKATGALLDVPTERLTSLLQKVVQAVLEAGVPRKQAFLDSRGAPLERDYGSLARVDLLLDDLSAFRDDAHIAAWSAEDVSARDIEALTQVWLGEAHDAAQLAERNEPFRGYGEDAYAESLLALEKRGWLQKVDGSDGGRYQITGAGAALRQRVEEATDDIFYGPWQALSSQELAELRTLLIRLKLGLQALLEEQQ